MPGWKRMVVGAVLGAAGALYATNEEFRKALPGKARDLPLAVRRRFEAATAAAREASALRRAEILRELEEHGAETRLVERRPAELGGETGPDERALPAPAMGEAPPAREAPLDEAPPEALLDAASSRPATEPNERGGSLGERPERAEEV